VESDSALIILLPAINFPFDGHCTISIVGWQSKGRERVVVVRGNCKIDDDIYAFSNEPKTSSAEKVIRRVNKKRTAQCKNGSCHDTCC